LALDWNAIGALTRWVETADDYVSGKRAGEIPRSEEGGFYSWCANVRARGRVIAFSSWELGRETKMKVEVHAWVELWDEVGILEEVRGLLGNIERLLFGVKAWVKLSPQIRAVRI